jgi:hypothetical protein
MRSGADTALMFMGFMGLYCFAGSLWAGETYDGNGEGLSIEWCMTLPSGEASGVGGRTALEPLRQIPSS